MSYQAALSNIDIGKILYKLIKIKDCSNFLNSNWIIPTVDLREDHKFITLPGVESILLSNSKCGVELGSNERDGYMPFIGITRSYFKC